MLNLDDLYPVEINSKMEIDKTTGRARKVVRLLTSKGLVLSTNLPDVWARYLKESINNYHALPESVKGYGKKIPNTIIATFLLPYRPLIYTSGTKLKKQKDGTYLLAPSEEYMKRIQTYRNARVRLISGREHMIPFNASISLECVYYIKKRENVINNLPQLLSATVDTLERIKIINKGVVVNVDKSRIVESDSPVERTLVLVREVIE